MIDGRSKLENSKTQKTQGNLRSIADCCWRRLRSAKHFKHARLLWFQIGTSLRARDVALDDIRCARIVANHRAVVVYKYDGRRQMYLCAGRYYRNISCRASIKTGFMPSGTALVEGADGRNAARAGSTAVSYIASAASWWRADANGRTGKKEKEYLLRKLETYASGVLHAVVNAA